MNRRFSIIGVTRSLRANKGLSLTIFAAVAIIVTGLSLFLSSVLAAGPFTVTPNSGPVEGGNEITITGSGFLGGQERPAEVVKLVASKGTTTSAGGNGYLLYSNGVIQSWGDNAGLQLGLGTTSTTDQSALQTVSLSNVPSGCKIVDVAAGHMHAIAVDDCGNIYTWGDAAGYALGNGTSTADVSRPTTPTGGVPTLTAGDKFVSVAAGYNASWIISDYGRIFVVGTSGTNGGYIGTGGTATINSFTATASEITNVGALANMNSGEKVIKISSSGHATLANRFTYALTNQGRVFGVGINTYQLLGDGSTTRRTTWVQSTQLTNIRDIDAGYLHAVAITNEGVVMTGGTSSYGYACNNATSSTATAKYWTTAINAGNLPGGNTGQIAVAAGYYMTHILGNNGQIYACGRTGAYGMGHGTTYAVPTTLNAQGSFSGAGVNVTQIADTMYNGFAIGKPSSGTYNGMNSLYTWGEASGNQIARPTASTTDQTTPLRYGISTPLQIGDSIPDPIVTIDGNTCSITEYSDTKIVCTAPAGTAGRADVTVTPSGGGSVQTFYDGYEYRDSELEYEIMNTSVNPYTYAVDPDTLRVNLSYTHASLITITYPRTASDGSTATMTNSVTMANSTMRTAIGGQCGGVACTTVTVKITGTANNIDGTNGLIAFLESLEWSGGAGYLRGDIRITVLPEDVEFWIDGDGNRHFYELVASGNSSLTWSEAYNLAANRTFKGLTGYLISMTEQSEASIIEQYTQNSGLSAVGYTSGIRFRNNDVNHTKVDGTIGYAGNATTAMPAMPTGQNSIGTNFACTATTSSMQSQGCTSTVAAITSTAVDACPSSAAYDTQWYWANPVDNGKEYYSGRTSGECSGNPLKNTELTSFWKNDQPQGGEFIMAYSSSDFGWHDYSNNAGQYYYVEYSEGWFDSGTYNQGETTYWSAPIPLEITIHHVRANTGEVLAPDTKAPSMGLNTTTNQFQCSLANGGKTIDGYYWSSSSCANGQFPYDPLSTTQEITYYYTHNSVPNPVPFRMQRGDSGGNYVYTMYNGDSGTAVDDFGGIRQVVITYPSELNFASVLPGGWSADITSGQTVITIPHQYGVTATEVQNYLYTVTLTASGMNDVTGTVVVEVADYANVPATGDPGRTSSSGALPQPIKYHYYRLGYTNDLIPASETIGLINQSFTLAAPTTYLPLGTNELTADYAFYQSSPAIGTTMTYRGSSTDVYFYYQPANGLTVSFSMNGETAVESVPDQLVVSGDNAVRPPADPVVLGKRFAGWYDSNTCTNVFDFGSTSITTNTTIYACFTPEANMTVVFDDTGLSGTPEISVNPGQLNGVVYNSLINEPTAPILPGYSFSSWNTEPMLDSTTCSGSPWNFASDRVSAPVGTSQITLYACWEARSNVTINFNTATNAPATIQVLPNPTSRSVQYNATTSPPTSPISEGYAFVNWRTEPMVDGTTCGGSAFNFTTTRLTAGSTTAYACWEKKADLTITFLKGEMDGNSGIQDWPTNVHDMPYNSAAAAYQPEAKLEGYILSHWCLSTNPNCTRNDRFDWSARQTSNLTLVAIWREDIMAIDEIVPEFGSTNGGYRVTLYGSGFLELDARSYVGATNGEGLMVLLDGENNTGTLTNPSHGTSATWNNLAPASAAAFGNFTLTNATVNDKSISFNGTSSQAKSGSTANLNGAIGGTTISAVTTEVAHNRNAVLANNAYGQLYEYGPIGYANTAANGSFGEVLNASALSTASAGNCYIGQRTSASAFNGGSGACANNTTSTTHTTIQSKSATINRRLIVDGNYSSPAVNVTNAATSFLATQSVVIAARTTNGGQTTYANRANVSVSSFRMYNRVLTDAEIRCNYYVDLLRFQGIYDSGLASCSSYTVPLMPDVLTINGEACTNIVINNDNQMTCVVPASTLPGDESTAPYREGTVDVYVEIDGETFTLEDGFTYQAPLAIFDVSPNAGPDTGGETITITGTDFRDLATSPSGVPEVSIGSNACTNVVLASDNHSLTCTVPASTTGAGFADVTVTIPNRSQSATITGGYNYYSSLSIDDVSPNVGDVNGGTVLTITGSGFGDTHLNYGVALDYGGTEPVACIITSQTDTTITCETSARTNPGVVNVTVSNSVAYVTQVAAFTYVQPASSYINECYDEDEGVWANGDQHYIYIEQGNTAECRLTFNAPYQGTVSVSDDYYATIDQSLSGSFYSNDSRFSGSVFTLTYGDDDVLTPTTGQVLYYYYTAPTASILEQYYDGTDTSEGYVGNGYDLYWPAIEITNSEDLPSGDSKLAVFGLLAQRYWIYPGSANTVYVVGSNGVFTVSTHGAYHPGTVSFSDDLTYSDDPSGTVGVFGADGSSPNNVVDLSELEGADSSFTYLPQTSATGLNYIRINGSSSPAINNTYYDIKVADSCLTVTGPTNMSRGETAQFTLTASCGSNWSGDVELSDPFNSSGEVGGAFADTSTGSNPSGTFNAGTKTYTFTPGANESYERTFNWTMRDDSTTPPTFPSYIVYITVNDGAGASYTPVFVNADTLRFACASGYPNCTTGYVGSLFDVAISPNGMMIGKALVTTDGGGTLGNNGIATWSTADPYVMSATPRTPGLKTLTATVTESNNPAMVNDAFVSTDATSFGDYIWVMANGTALSGSDEGMYNKPNTYTMTLNGPFEGTIELSDVLTGTSTSAGGAFSVSSCSFSKSNYDTLTNTTSCTFTYTPAAYMTDTSVTLRANKQASYVQAVASSTLDLTVYSPATIVEVCRVGTGGDTGFPCDNSGTLTGGDAIVIRGTNFVPYNNDTPSITVTFDMGGTPATCSSVVVVDNNTITCTTPAHSVGTVDVSVNNGEETALSVGGFVFRPVLSAISPGSGLASGGETLTITGDGFVAGQTTASINGNACTNVNVINSTTLTCTAPISTLPGGGMGLADVDVSVYGIAAPTLANAYQYELALAISSVTPNIGTPAGGTQITVIGVGFVSGQTVITVGGGQCTNVTVQSSNQLTCNTPASTLSTDNNEGVVSVTVSDGTNPSHTLTDGFTYRKPMEAALAAPNPVPTAGGTTLTILGYNFIPPSSYTGGAPTTVTFIDGSNGEHACTNVNVVNNSTITCTTPVANVGTYDIRINNGYETTVLNDVLAYEPNPLIVTGVDPDIGLTTGGDSISITGSGFTETYKILDTRYTQLEYLTFSGAQYINTGVNPTTNFAVEADFQYNTVANTTASYLFGTRTGTSAGHFSFFKTTSAYFSDAWGTTTTTQAATFNTNRHQIIKNNGNTLLDNTTIATRTGNSTASTRPLYIGQVNNAGAVLANSYYNGRIWSFKISSAGTLVRDYVPAYDNQTSTCGLYDLVNNTFYASNGTAFACTDPELEIIVEIGDLPCTNAVILSDTEMTCTVPSRTSESSPTGTFDVYVEIGDQNNTLVGAYTYIEPASSYVNECRADATSDWEVELYVPQGSTVQCRIVLDNPYNGTISLSDDYATTIDPALSGIFSSTDGRFLSGSFSLTYENTLDEADQSLYYTYTSPSSTTLDSYYEAYAPDCGEERCDNGYDLFWPLLTATPSTSLSSSLAGEVLLGLLAEKYYVFPDSGYSSYCVDCTIGFTVSTRGAPYFGTITLSDDLSNSNNPGGTSGVFSVGGVNSNEVDMSELDGGDGSFDYTPKTAATGTNYLRVYGESSDPVITDNHYDLNPVSQSTLTITGPTMLHRGESGSFTLTLVDAAGWAGTVSLSDLFSIGGVAGGVFVDTTNDGSYNALTNTYTFQNNQNETYERTFTYTMPSSADLVGYVIRLTGDNGTSTGYSSVAVLADDLFTKCGANYPNCTTAYVGEAKDLSIAPNGTLIGNGQVTDHSGGQITRGGAISWNNADPFVISYSPATAGHKTLTTTVSSSTNTSMDQQSYNSTDSSSLNGYIYVMANRMTLSGSNTMVGGATKTYTLTLNGPFDGTINFSDVYANGSLPAGGVFSNTSCSFTLANYVYTDNNESLGTGTTTCTFDYTPATVSSNQTVRIDAAVSGSYPHEMILTPVNIVVRTPMAASGVSPNIAVNTGGETITITGNNLHLTNNITVGGAACTNIVVNSATSVSCTTPAYNGVGSVNVVVSNSDGETQTMTNAIEYYTPLAISSVSPYYGPDRGDSVVVITGSGFIAPGLDAEDIVVWLGGAECVINNPATDVTNTSITCTTSGHTAEVVDVSIDNGNESAVLTAGFAYIESMTLDSVCQVGTGPTVDDDPECRPYGLSAGGEEVVLTGSNFIAPDDINEENTSVIFDYGGVEVECTITAITNETIHCTTGAHDPGLVNVRVEHDYDFAEIEAEPGDTTADLPVSGYLYMDTYINSSNDHIMYSVSMTSPENSGYDVKQVGTNNPSGYTLSMLSNGSDLVCTTNNSEVIPSLTTDGALTNDTNSSWGYNIVPPSGTWTGNIPATPGTWKKIPSATADVLINSDSPAFPGQEDNFGLFFGTKIKPTQAPCSYTQILLLTVVANVW